MLKALLFAALLSTSIGQSIVITLLPALGRSAGLSELQVALILSSSSVVFVLGAYFWGDVGARWGRCRVLLIGMGGYTLGTLVFTGVFYLGLTGGLTGVSLLLTLLLARSLQSSIMSATPPSVLGLTVAISTPQTQVKDISRVTAANTLGQVLGPALAGALVVLGLLVPIYAVIALTLLTWILLVLKLPSHHLDRPTDTPMNSLLVSVNSSEIGTRSFFGNPGLFYVLTASMLFCAMAMIYQTLGFFFMDMFGKTPQQAAQVAGFAAMVTALVSFVVQFLLIQRLPFSGTQLLLLGLLSLVAGLLLLAFSSGVAMIYLAMTLIGLGMGLAYPTATATAVSSGNTRQQSQNTGLVSAAPALGFIVGPLLAATVYPLQPHYPFVLAAMLLAGLLAAHGWRQKPSKPLSAGKA